MTANVDSKDNFDSYNSEGHLAIHYPHLVRTESSVLLHLEQSYHQEEIGNMSTS
ncbi:Hypothetical protein FKW44_002573 [Caligus rogercresseyi]|uniref:Uncharacterized protein n=1 Tax=Caligus rogercresseyi TaxID=217165 RepID=A0A7T8QWF2_CALRO|nr:Hypothetical protein FKW44_002573 [Caligus rogercresseyi]